MTWGMVAVAGAGLAGGLISANASKKAAQTQADAANKANDMQYQMFQEQNQLQEPFRQAGLTSTNRLLDLLGLSGNQGAEGYGSLTRPFSMSDFQADPGYGFRLKEGLKALDQQAAARGGLISGNALKAAQDYGQQAASQEYQNAFNRYQINRGNVLNPLQAMSGQGQSATNMLTGAAGQYGQQYGENVQNAANARASGYVGQANAISGGIGQYLNYQQNQNWLKALQQQQPSYPTSSYPGVPYNYGADIPMQPGGGY